MTELKGLKIIGKITLPVGTYQDEIARLKAKVKAICNGETLKLRGSNIETIFKHRKMIQKVKLYGIRFTNRGIMLDLSWGSLHINNLNKSNLHKLVNDLKNLETECLYPRYYHNSPFKSK